MKNTLPVLLGMLVGCYMVVEYFIPHYAVRDVSAHVLEWGGIVAAAAYVIGGVNLVQVTWPKIRRREADWGYKVVLLASAAIMAIVGLPWRTMTGTTREPGWAMRLAPSPELVRSHRARVIVEAPDDVITSVGPRMVAGPNIVTIDPGEIVLKAGRRVVGYDTFEAQAHTPRGRRRGDRGGSADGVGSEWPRAHVALQLHLRSMQRDDVRAARVLRRVGGVPRVPRAQHRGRAVARIRDHRAARASADRSVDHRRRCRISRIGSSTSSRTARGARSSWAPRSVRSRPACA